MLLCNLFHYIFSLPKTQGIFIQTISQQKQGLISLSTFSVGFRMFKHPIRYSGYSVFLLFVVVGNPVFLKN